MDAFKITMYTRKQCPLCDKAMAVLIDLKNEFSIDISEVDIYQDDELLEKYQIMIPVIEINGEEVDHGIIIKDTLRNYLLSKMG